MMIQRSHATAAMPRKASGEVAGPDHDGWGPHVTRNSPDGGAEIPVPSNEVQVRAITGLCPDNVAHAGAEFFWDDDGNPNEASGGRSHSGPSSTRSRS